MRLWRPQFCMAHVLREFRPDMTDAQFYNEGIEKVTESSSSCKIPRCLFTLTWRPLAACLLRTVLSISAALSLTLQVRLPGSRNLLRHHLSHFAGDRAGGANGGD
jgi:hypothetical protein